MKPGMENATAYHLAFTHLNKKLYGGKLPIPMLILTRDRRITMGHFGPLRWADTSGKKTIHEIAVNVNCNANRDARTVFGVLAHEMTHLWQQEHGKPTRNGYHNKEWAREATRVGLEIQGGGQSVHTEIIEGGITAKAIESMPEDAAFPWISSPVCALGGEKPGKKQGKSGIRSKYVCPVCGLKAWAKPEAELICGQDRTEMVEETQEEKED